MIIHIFVIFEVFKDNQKKFDTELDKTKRKPWDPITTQHPNIPPENLNVGLRELTEWALLIASQTQMSS